MIYHLLGKTGLQISSIGLGTWQLGGTDIRVSSEGQCYHAGWGEMSDTDALQIIASAVRVGINIFDTADIYGAGRSERTIGRYLEQHDREQTVIVTKFGIVPDDFIQPRAHEIEIENGQSCSPEYINLAYAASTERLHTNYIDVYLLHISNPQLVRKHQPWKALKELRATKKIISYGASVDLKDVSWVEELIEEHQCQVIELPYNIYEAGRADAIVRLCNKKKVGVLARSPLKAGALSGRYQPGYSFPPQDWRNHCFGKRVEFDQATQLIQKVGYLTSAKRTLAQTALGFALANEFISSVIVGIRTPDQIAENAMSLNSPLSSEEVNCIREIISGDNN